MPDDGASIHPVTTLHVVRDFSKSLPASSNQSARSARSGSQYAPSPPPAESQGHHLSSALAASHCLPAASPSTQVSCLCQRPPPSRWTLVTCKNGYLSGATLSTDDKQPDLLSCSCPLFYAHLRQYTTSTFCSSYKKIYSPKISHICSWLDMSAYVVSSPGNSLPPRSLIDSRL